MRRSCCATSCEDALRAAIRDGRLSPGERLPSSRTLAAPARGRAGRGDRVLRAAPGGGVPALAARVGHVGGRRGRAASPMPPHRRSSRRRCASTSVRACPTCRRSRGPTGPAACGRRSATLRTRCSATPTVPVSRSCATCSPATCAGCATPTPGPRRWSCARGSRRGCTSCCRRSSRAASTTIAVEDPGDRRLARASRPGSGMRVVPVPVDAEGIVVEALGGVAGGAGDPGAPVAHRGACSARDVGRSWSGGHGRTTAVILEDDYDAELRYGDEPVGALQGLAPDRVVLLGSVSKSLAPGLRLGWVLCPPALVRPVADAKARADRGSPCWTSSRWRGWCAPAGTTGTCAGCACGTRSGGRYWSRRCARTRPGVRVGGLAAGFHLVASLPPGVSEEAVVAGARERSVGLYPMSAYRSSSLSSQPRAARARLRERPDAGRRGRDREGRRSPGLTAASEPAYVEDVP